MVMRESRRANHSRWIMLEKPGPTHITVKSAVNYPSRTPISENVFAHHWISFSPFLHRHLCWTSMLSYSATVLHPSTVILRFLPFYSFRCFVSQLRISYITAFQRETLIKVSEGAWRWFYAFDWLLPHYYENPSVINFSPPNLPF